MANGGGSSSSALPGHLDSSVAPPAQMVNGGRSSSSALPGHLGSSVTLQTQMLNGGEGASGILPVQDDPAGQQASDDQPTFNTSNFLKDIFPSMASQVTTFLIHSAYFSGSAYEFAKHVRCI
jgi:hypothetical protein